MDYKQGLLKNSRLTETELLRLLKAVLLAVQQDLAATNGKAFHLLEGIVRANEDGTYIFTPSPFLEKLIKGKGYPEVLKIEELKLLNWIVALLEDKE